MWYVAQTRSGQLVNLDYLDGSSDEVTHQSVSAGEFEGIGWNGAVDVLLWGGAVGELIVEWVARVGYQGNLHFWNARGGEYEYQNRRGRFEDDRHFVRYIVLHQVFFGGMHAQLGHRGTDGMGGWAETCPGWR